MLILHRSQVYHSRMVPVLSSEVGQIVEGQPVCSTVSGGVGYASRSGSGTSQTFLGIAAGPVRSTYNVVKSERVYPTASNLTIVLKRTVTSYTNVSVVDSSGTRLTVQNTAPSTGQVQVGTDSATGHSNLTFNSAQAGGTFDVMYSTPANATDILVLWPGYPSSVMTPAEDLLAAIPIVTRGVFATDQFAPGEDWSSSPGVKVGATGVFLPSGSSTSGTALSGSVVVKAPTFSDPVLIVELR